MTDLEAAQARVSKWRKNEGGIWRERIVMLAANAREKRLHVGSNVVLPKAVRDRIRAEAGVDVEFTKVHVRFHQGAGDALVRPLVGGTQIQSTEAEMLGTLGLVVQSVIGDIGLLTAGHFVGAPGDAIGQPDDDNANLVATVVANNFIAPGTVDGAFAIINSNTQFQVGGVWQPGGAPALVLDNLINVPDEDSPCTMQGADTGTSAGQVVYNNVEIGNLTNVALATYAAQEGDSGGPVFNGTSFLGVHSLAVDNPSGGTLSGFTQVSGLLQVVNFNLG
ncbi:MAG TPA: trypsin-like serine protease [Thermoanaerobaculia bacterium]|nr:trypsin-like serine protease [Thermoanaerobaculia bacterium]